MIGLFAPGIRNRSWSDDVAVTLRLLNGLKVQRPMRHLARLENVGDLQDGVVTRRIKDDALPRGPIERLIEYHARSTGAVPSWTIDSPGPSSSGESNRDRRMRASASSPPLGGQRYGSESA